MQYRFAVTFGTLSTLHTAGAVHKKDDIQLWSGGLLKLRHQGEHHNLRDQLALEAFKAPY